MAIRRKKRQRGYRKSLEPEHKINQKIDAPKVRVVGENIESGVYSRGEALQLADDEGLDLVLISPKADPPVCKIIDYKKFLFEQKKKKKELKAKAQKVVIKDMRFGPNTSEHDFNFKLKHIETFLQDGCKVKAYVFFRGRTIMFKDQGQLLLLKLAQAVEEIGVVEQMPKMEGRRMIMFIAPKKKK